METDTLSLELEGDHFALRRGGQTLANLSFIDVLALANVMPSFQQYIVSRMRPEEIVAEPIVDTAAIWDGLRENVLLQLKFSQGGGAIYKLPAPRSVALANRLQELAAEQPFPSSKQ